MLLFNVLQRSSMQHPISFPPSRSEDFLLWNLHSAWSLWMVNKHPSLSFPLLHLERQNRCTTCTWNIYREKIIQLSTPECKPPNVTFCLMVKQKHVTSTCSWIKKIRLIIMQRAVATCITVHWLHFHFFCPQQQVTSDGHFEAETDYIQT